MVDVNCDFTKDTKGYWEYFYQNKTTNGAPDPDAISINMQKTHQKLWSRKLPNNEVMQLNCGNCSTYYLTWKNFRFGADSIINMYFHHKESQLTPQIKDAFCQKYRANNFESFVEQYLHKSYTIGGSMIFPKNGYHSINLRRYAPLKDRFDLFLECIRKYYVSEDNPLNFTLKANANFFALFNNFKGFVDFFFLQDLVSYDYTKINYFNNQDNLYNIDYPQNTQEWLDLYDNQLDFVEKRNKRIIANFDRTN